MEHEHSFASPGPCGLGALAMACFTFFAILTGKVTHDALPIFACWMVGGGICQLVAGLIELKDGNIVGGNVFTFFAAFFMFTTALSLATTYGLKQAGLPIDGRIAGWAWLAGACFLTVMTPCYLKKSPAILFLAILMIDIALFCVVALDLQLDIDRKMVATLAGWLLFASGWIGIYLAGAIAMNTHFGKVILPTTPPIIK